MGFSSVIGQEKGVAVLRRSLEGGRLAHAYLFEGIEGCGKKTAALALVEALFCESACGACPSCRRVRQLQHPDLHLLEPQGTQIKIEQVRELQKTLAFRPLEAKRKACIIDGADRLNASSGNALLKTLEEPPGDALIILLTDNPDTVLPTILSRCQRLRFTPLPEELIEQALLEKGIDPETARFCAAAAGGSLGAALAAAGEESQEAILAVLEKALSVSERDVLSLFAAAEELGSDREKGARTVALLKQFFRDLLLFVNGAGGYNEFLLDLLQREGERRTAAEVLENMDTIRRAEDALQRNVNPRLTLEVLFLSLSSR